jgi:cytidine deaminase
VAVSWEGVVLPPCGRCRELMVQIDGANYTDTEVILGVSRVVKLKELLPHQFAEVRES